MVPPGRIELPADPYHGSVLPLYQGGAKVYNIFFNILFTLEIGSPIIE